VIKDQMRLPKSKAITAVGHKSDKVTLSEAEAKKIIREMHLKVTSQRLLILNILSVSGKHFMAQEIYEKIHVKHPEVGFATVYRFLKKLTDSGYVTEMRIGGLPARYEIAPSSHHVHMSCTDCGKVVEFESYAIENLQEKVANDLGFQLTGHVLELYGLCPSCQK
jgi:Fur family ferric uptake transcriptional regulator